MQLTGRNRSRQVFGIRKKKKWKSENAKPFDCVMLSILNAMETYYLWKKDIKDVIDRILSD